MKRAFVNAVFRRVVNTRTCHLRATAEKVMSYTTRKPHINPSSLIQEPKPVLGVEARTTSRYPSDFRPAVRGRAKRRLGDAFGLVNFGVNHTTLAPGASSALAHYHARQDEFVYILSGTATLRLVVARNDDDNGDGQQPATREVVMRAGDCMGFPRGVAVGHCLTNRGDEPVVYLEVGDRSPNDVCEYPGVDLRALDGHVFVHKDGRPY